MLFNSRKCYFMHAWQVYIYRSFTNNAVKLNDFFRNQCYIPFLIIRESLEQERLGRLISVDPASPRLHVILLV